MQTYDGKAVDVKKFVDQLDTSDEVAIPKSGKMVVQTKNSLYEFDLTAGKVRGGIVGSEWHSGHPVGTTFGGSMIKLGVVIPDCYLEFVAGGEVYRSSPIKSVEIVD